MGGGGAQGASFRKDTHLNRASPPEAVDTARNDVDVNDCTDTATGCATPASHTHDALAQGDRKGKDATAPASHTSSRFSIRRDTTTCRALAATLMACPEQWEGAQAQAQVHAQTEAQAG
jgi:hypothetical protein